MRFLRLQAPHCDSRNHQLVESSRRRRKKTRVEVSEHTLGIVEMPKEKESADFHVACKPGVQAISVRFQSRSRSLQPFCRPGQIARGERDFGLRYYAPRTGHNFFGAEGTRSISQEFFRPREVA
jgi:hypothetical protein